MESIGDLARLSYNSDILYKRKLCYTLSKSHLHKENFRNQKLDLITIGDSFSYGGAYGKNPFYQDYLSSVYNINVLNIGTKNISEYIEAAVNLHNNGFLKKHHTKYLLLESVERLIPLRFAKKINWNCNYKTIIRIKTKKPYHQNVNFISTANYKTVFFNLQRSLFPNKNIHGIYSFKLTKKLFTNKSNRMLIYYSDIQNIPLFNKKNIRLINQNLNKLAKILKKDGITLIFMPVVDKFDLYEPYIQNNQYQKNNFFKEFHHLKKEYLFIDTKALFSPLLEKGIQDLYYIGDTHWSYKASQALVNAPLFQQLFTHKEHN
jgi:hypothetical protein